MGIFCNIQNNSVEFLDEDIKPAAEFADFILRGDLDAYGKIPLPLGNILDAVNNAAQGPGDINIDDGDDGNNENQHDHRNNADDLINGLRTRMDGFRHQFSFFTQDEKPQGPA